MSKNNNKGVNIAKVGNFTKNAVKTFESNIVDQTNYLEKIKKNLNDLK